MSDRRPRTGLRTRTATTSRQRGDTVRLVIAWTIDNAKALGAVLLGLAAAVAFVLAVRADATAGAELVPRVSALERDVAEIKTILPRVEGTLDAIYYHLIGRPPSPKGPTP